MKNIRVIVNGVGGIGSHLIRLLAEKKGVEIVGALDIAPEKLGRDAGEAAGGAPIGVRISSDAAALYQKGADVVICTSAPTSPEETFRQLKPALEAGINAIAANMGTCNLWVTDPALAAEADAVCKARGVSYFGIGATQMQDRFILQNTEGCARIDRITFTHFADLHAFHPESFRVEWGVTLTEEAFYRGVADGSIQKHDYFANGIYSIAWRLGWRIDRVTSAQVPLVDKSGMVYGTHFTFAGYQGEAAKIETNWIFLLDEKRRYYDRVTVQGSPCIDSMNNFSPDRGMVSTYASLVNAIPAALRAQSGYINTLDLPSCTLIDDELYRHI